MHLPSPNFLTVSDHRLGASLAYLGFPCSWTSTVQESTRTKHIQFFFEPQSVRFPSLPLLPELLRQWRSDTLPSPHHLLAVSMRAHANYDALIKWQAEGTQQHLDVVGDLAAYRYVPGTPPLSTYATPLSHLHLAAALAELGFAVGNITGTDRAHLYWLSPHPQPLRDSAGELMQHPVSHYALAHVSRLAPTREDPRRLALEDEHPLHPLVIAYNTLRCRAEIKHAIDRAQSRLLIEDGHRQALISMRATGHTMSHVAAHFKAPPL